MNWFVRFWVSWAVNVVVLLTAEAIDEGLRIEPEWRVFTAGLVLGFLNASVRPILKALAAPLIVLTLGLALFFVNLGSVWIATEIASGFEADDANAVITVAVFLWIANVIVQFVSARAQREEKA